LLLRSRATAGTGTFGCRPSSPPSCAALSAAQLEKSAPTSVRATAHCIASRTASCVAAPVAVNRYALPKPGARFTLIGHVWAVVWLPVWLVLVCRCRELPRSAPDAHDVARDAVVNVRGIVRRDPERTARISAHVPTQ
jgi:hypothetical protein